MKKLIILSVCLNIFTTLLKPIEIWTDINISKQIDKLTVLQVNQEFEMAKGIHHLYWYQIQTRLFRQVTSFSSAASEVTYIRREKLTGENPGIWINEVELAVLSQQEFGVWPLQFLAQERFYWRLPQKSKKHAAFDLMLGFYLIKNPVVTMYATDEITFNYFGFKKIDYNIATINLNITLIPALVFGVYFQHYIFKPESTWNSSNVVGFLVWFRF